MGTAVAHGASNRNSTVADIGPLLPKKEDFYAFALMHHEHYEV
jgi:hypothetical protein